VTIQAGDGPPARPQALLFTPGPRLGWTFRDRRSLVAPYPEPPPDPDAIRAQAEARRAATQRSLQRAEKWVARPSLMLAVALLMLAAFAKTTSRHGHAGGFALLALILCGPGLAWTAWCWCRRFGAVAADPTLLYDHARREWEDHAARHEHTELARLDQVPEWGSAQSPVPRTDVFGGTLAGWRSLLTVHGASIMAAQPLLVADLSGQYAAGQLAALAREVGVPVAEYALPRDLNRCGLLSGLSARQLADALTEAIHAGPPGQARTDRAVDVRVLEQLSSALAGRGITPVRLAAAVQVALGRPIPPGLLTRQETDLIGGPLFGGGARAHIGANLIRLDAFLSPLASYAGTGPPAAPRPAYCTILVADPAARGVRAELISALVIQWLTVQVTVSAGHVPAVVIAAADEITGHHLERLAGACELRGVPLTLLFRHLRDDATTLLGGGATAFMRLGNHHEAEQAASFMGRHHRFVLSGFTATHGGSHSSGSSDTYTYGTTESRGITTEDHFGAATASGGRTRSREQSGSQSWSSGLTWEDGTNWSDAATMQRVYEYAVEPAVLQNLPDNALLLPTRGAGRLAAVECHPAIITLPGVSTTPLFPAQTRPPPATKTILS
jgi:hypothetical protein